MILSSTILSSLFIASTLATPPFPPPVSERGYGLAPERRGWNDASRAQAEKLFAEANQKKADDVASKYPVDYL